MTNPVIGSKPMVFSNLFYTGRFVVPWHQRRYDWEGEHISDLLRDIDEAIAEDRKCYFLGAIMLVKKEDRLWEINDGQQRMVTFSLICAYLCRRFNNEEEKSSIHEALALRIPFDLDENSTENLSNADKLKPRLTPPRDDQSRYNLMIRGKNVGANGKLTEAWKEIGTFVTGMDIGKAKIFFEFLIKKVEVACLFIPVDIDPNSVYETINCRGKQLEALDLIRNYLYSHFNSSKEQNRRDTVHNDLENVRTQLRDDKRAADYARCYFQCRYGFLPKDRFYRGVRWHISSNTSKFSHQDKSATYVYDLVSEFAKQERVELFRAISNPKIATGFIDQFLKDSSEATSKRNLRVFLQELQTYKIAQPILFALLVHYRGTDSAPEKKKLAKFIHRTIRNLNSFIMRTAFVSPKFESSHFESEFSDLARKITSVDTVYSINIMDHLRGYDGTYNIIDDSKFVAGIAEMEMRDSRKAKRFLIGLNSYRQTDGEVINENKSTVEHILPTAVQHSSGWGNFQDTSEWIYRIGNLTLLGENDNKPGKEFNKDFSTKKNIFKKSVFTLTRELDKYSDWSPAKINKRQKEMADLAAKVWTFDAKAKSF